MPVQNTRPTRDPSRTRRTMLTLAAAAAVVLLPTACDYAVAETGGSGGGYGLPSGHSGHGAPTVSDVETVPAGATQDLDPAEPVPTEPEPAEPGSGVPDPAEPDATEPDPAAEVPDAGDGSGVPTSSETETETTDETVPPSTIPTSTTEPSTSTAPPVVNPPAPAPLEILGNDCTTSDLGAHTGFQDAPRCVAIAFGEVAAAALSPSLLITEAPTAVASGEAFTLTVSTRNLKRDRFLGAAAGGYYRESSFLTEEEGIQRGHFHTACRLLPNLDEAPNAEPVPAFFLATQDNGGGTTPDQVVVPVTAINGTGTLQCAVWAGDGSHRVPMMQRANQTPAFDIVRIEIG